MPLRILIAPSGFKESLGSSEVADCIESGILRVIPDAKITKKPLVDGGEGFTRALVEATGGTIHDTEVTGPVGKKIQSHFGFLGDTERKTAVLEMSAAAGLRLVPRDSRDPLITSTFGVGELIKAALDGGAEKILVGCGDSGTNDGGLGMAQALGIRFSDTKGNDLPRGGKSLEDLGHIDFTNIDPRLKNVRIDVACNWRNLLCGPQGVATVFGPQKGSSPETVARLKAGLENYAAIIKKHLDLDVYEMPGGGASGGLGTGLYALLGAKLFPWIDIVLHYLNIDSFLEHTDLVITAEGSVDEQTLKGKIPYAVAQKAKVHYLPVITMAGTIGNNANLLYEHGIDAITGILEKPCSLPDAIREAESLLVNSVERTMRLVALGQILK